MGKKDKFKHRDIKKVKGKDEEESRKISRNKKQK
jgi:hypothetical protein